MSAMFSAVAAATTNTTSVKPSPGILKGWFIINTSASPRFVRIYDKATAPVPSTDAALIKIRFPLPAGDGTNQSLGDVGPWFQKGLAFDITAGAADTDATVCVAGDVTINLFYE